jgi:flavin-dependent dehydrogenase
MTNDYDVVIIGAGPAGMFAADELADSDLRVLVIDSGQDIDERACPMKRIMWMRFFSNMERLMRSAIRMERLWSG